MVSDGFGPPDFISAIKFYFWGQIQDGRRRPYWIAKKKNTKNQVPRFFTQNHVNYGFIP